MDTCELTAFVSATAITMHNCIDPDELELIASIYVALGDMLLLMLVNDGLLEKCCNRKKGKTAIEEVEY